MNTNNEHLKEVVNRLKSEGAENEWLEFKHNNGRPELVGQYISSLSNSAVILDKPKAYVIWGVDDTTHDIVGTTFNPMNKKVGNEEFLNWLARSVEPSLDFSFHEVLFDDKRVVLLEIPATTYKPVKFKGEEYIRIGSSNSKLHKHVEKERLIWDKLKSFRFEEQIAASDLSADDALALLDYPSYFEMMGQPLPDGKANVLDIFVKEKMLQNKNGIYSITNLGAILFAKNLSDFDRLSRKSMRVIQYEGKNKVKTIREQEGIKGYAVGFEGAISFIDNLLPRSESIGKALRKEVAIYPELAIRELLANAIIHQDFSIEGTGPMVEIYSDRIEITNPGVPLIEIHRLMDNPPLSRNESLASMLRRMNICEERGTGIDKVIFEVELFQLPAPKFETYQKHTKVTLYTYRKLTEMDKDDKIRATYQHACLKYVSNEVMTNASLRERFKISAGNSALASRIIADASAAGLIKQSDPENQSKRHMKYVPFWA